LVMYKIQIIIFILFGLAVFFGFKEVGKIRQRNKILQEALLSFKASTKMEERQQIAEYLKRGFEANKSIFDFSFSSADDGVLCGNVSREAKKEVYDKGVWNDLKTTLRCQ